jgi:hypothetical protein
MQGNHGRNHWSGQLNEESARCKMQSQHITNLTRRPNPAAIPCSWRGKTLEPLGPEQAEQRSRDKKWAAAAVKSPSAWQENRETGGASGKTRDRRTLALVNKNTRGDGVAREGTSTDGGAAERRSKEENGGGCFREKARMPLQRTRTARLRAEARTQTLAHLSEKRTRRRGRKV